MLSDHLLASDRRSPARRGTMRSCTLLLALAAADATRRRQERREEEVRAAAVAEPLPDGYTESGQLLKAVMAGDVKTAEKWLEMGVNPNAGYETLADWTPLHYAAQLGHTKIIDTLLDHGAEPQPLDRFEQTPLMQSGYWGRAEAKELLVRQGGGEESSVPAKMVMEAESASKIGRWDVEGTVTIICSAPEFTLPYEDGTKDNVMKALFALCDMHYKHCLLYASDAADE